MSILRKFDSYNEECVVCFANEGDERIFMPLCGVTKCLPGYKIQRQHSPECVFEYIVSGSGSYHNGDRVYHPKTGDIYIAGFGTTHHYASNDDNPWHKLWFNIRGTLVQELIYLYQIEHLEYLPDSGLESVFRECLQAMRDHPDNAKETASFVTHKLIYHISEVSRGKKQISDTAFRLKKILDSGIASNLTFAEAAKKFSYSQSQLTRIFRNAYGETPYAYLLSRRIELAGVMLSNSSLAVKEIAERTGFSDPYYFSNIFKLKFGISPRAFREKNRR